MDALATLWELLRPHFPLYVPIFTVALILMLSVAAFFLEFLRMIDCSQSLERNCGAAAFFEDPNSLKKVPCPSIFDPAEKYISLIVPAFNEEHRLPGALIETFSYLQERAQLDKSFSYEMQHERHSSPLQRYILK